MRREHYVERLGLEGLDEAAIDELAAQFPRGQHGVQLRRSRTGVNPFFTTLVETQLSAVRRGRPLLPWARP